MQFFYDFIQESITLWLEISPYLLIGMFIAGVLHMYVGKEFISRHLGKGGFFSVIKATVMGVPLPVCSCAVIPLASSLRKDGAHKSSVLSFLVSTPTTGVDSILATYSLMGPLFAVFRPIASMVSGMVVGMLNLFFERGTERRLTASHKSHSEMGLSVRLKEFVRYVFVEIPEDLGKWLVLGTLLGGLISTAIPQEVMATYFSFPFDFLAALIVGIPLYVCATGSIPVAVSLIGKGLSPGAALVFLIAGPATNAITLSFVRARLGKRSFYQYLVTVILSSFILGFAFNYIWQLLGSPERLITGGGEMLSFGLKLTAGAALLLIIVVAYALEKKKVLLNGRYDLSIKVPDMHCSHCRITLENELKGVAGVKKVFADVDHKTVKIQGNPDTGEVKNKIRQTGYTPEE